MGYKLNYYDLSIDSCDKHKCNYQHGVEPNPATGPFAGSSGIRVAHAGHVSASAVALWLRPIRMTEM